MRALKPGPPLDAPMGMDVAAAQAIEDRLGTAWWALRIGLGAGAVVAGLDKFFDRLTTWSMYLSPLAERLLPVSGAAFMRAVGVVEMAVGLAILTRWTRLGAYVMAVWLLAIAVNLAAAGSFWDLMLRDVEVAISAFALGRLTEWRTAAGADRSGGPSPAR
jgi:uncharacterized membrane protein YphA (DoxX/SURF4 family)